MTTHHTTAQKIQHVHDWRASGLTRLQYCRLHGLSSHAFHEWLRLKPSFLQPIGVLFENSL
ncbi:IS66 family insertion sequence element accessory protein TnpA [Salmonella bongori]|uniref:IS66 family insertion sequence element accessory protein TnpA n=1 Tax=Salmonella bongori TaxID=54736 RepID=UPI00112F3C0D